MKYFTSYLYIIFVLFLLVSSGYSQKATAEFMTSISPPSINHIPVKDGERYVTYRNNWLFIVNFWTGIQILDVSDIHNPRKLGFIQTKDMVHHIAFHNNQLFVANESNGVIVYDISDITRPVQIARIKTPGDAYWVDMDYPYLYVAMGMDGFSVMDVTNFEVPRTLSLEISTLPPNRVDYLFMIKVIFLICVGCPSTKPVIKLFSYSCRIIWPILRMVPVDC